VLQVVLRSASRRQGVSDLGRNERRLETIRKALGFEVGCRTALQRSQRDMCGFAAMRVSLGHVLCLLQVVPILRNRQRALIVIESPIDSFGPEPPAGGAESVFQELQDQLVDAERVD
jgi:hypothetical protein